MLSRQEQSQPGRNVVGIERTQGFEAREYKKISAFRQRFSQMVMRFPVIANWSNPSQTFAYKRFEEGTDFCESTDFLSEALSTLLELI